MRLGGEYKWEINRDRGFCCACRRLNDSGLVELHKSDKKHTTGVVVLDAESGVHGEVFERGSVDFILVTMGRWF